MGLCRTTAGFSHLKGQVLKIIKRSVCGEEAAAGLSVLRHMNSNREAFLFNDMTGVLGCVLKGLCWGLIVMGS